MLRSHDFNPRQAIWTCGKLLKIRDKQVKQWDTYPVVLPGGNDKMTPVILHHGQLQEAFQIFPEDLLLAV